VIDTDTYPFHASLRDVFTTAETPLLALRFIRRIMFALKITQTEAEIVLVIGAHDEPSMLCEISDGVSYFPEEQLKRLLKAMVMSNVIDARPCSGEHGFAYSIKPTIVKTISSFNAAALI
jgi:hypothetical protein